MPDLLGNKGRFLRGDLYRFAKNILQYDRHEARTPPCTLPFCVPNAEQQTEK